MTDKIKGKKYVCIAWKSKKWLRLWDSDNPVGPASDKKEFWKGVSVMREGMMLPEK